MTELSPPTLNFLTMFATVPMLIPCDLAQSACFKMGGWASSKSSSILHLLARVSFVDFLRSILLSNETSSSDRLTEYDFGLAIVTSPLVVSDGRKYITGLYKCQCVESLDAKKRHREDDECECIDDNDYLDDQELYYVDGVPVYGADDQEDAEIQYWNTH